jgi:hypothetical protein
MLMAQARVERSVLVTSDRTVLGLGDAVDS